ncbi:MAG: DNA gyrase subunit A [Limisphaerales bacterium]
MRARAEVEEDARGRERIIIHELPYQLNKARLIEKIAALVKDKKIEGITELRDESDKDGMRVVIEVRRGDSGEVILNNLYTQTQLQSVFGINCVALVDGQPKVLNIKQMLEAFLQHRKEVVTRRTLYLLRRARQRGHILEGQAVALANIDAVIELIKSSASAGEARVALIERRWEAEALFELLEKVGSDACKPDGLSEDFGFNGNLYRLTEEQAQAILEIRLHRLTAMEQDKLMEDYQGVLDEIADLLDILGSHERLLSVIRDELNEIKDNYGDERRTEIVATQQDLSVEDLITEEDLVVTISHQGYGKTQPLEVYQAQRRGGRGKAATSVKDEDFVEHLVIANSHDMLLCFSNVGKVYWLKAFLIPQGSRGAKGRPMINILPLAKEERITAIMPVTEYSADSFVFMATANGTVKKTPLEQFSRPRPSGLIALELEEGNTLVGVAITSGTSDVLLVSSAGKAARFKESDVRAMGRTARGVRGIKLKTDQRLIALIIPQEDGTVLTASENGYGKRTDISDFPVKGRGGQGVIGMQTSDRNGQIVGAVQVFTGDEVMLISNMGTLVRTAADEISVLGRNTQGVRLINLKGEEQLNSVERIAEEIGINAAESAALAALGDEEGEEENTSPTDAAPTTDAETDSDAEGDNSAE